MSEKLTLNEGLALLSQLKKRQAEIISLRDRNSAKEISIYDDKPVERTPTYDAKALDRQVASIGRQIRLLDREIKKKNSTVILDFTADEAFEILDSPLS